MHNGLRRFCNRKIRFVRFPALTSFDHALHTGNWRNDDDLKWLERPWHPPTTSYLAGQNQATGKFFHVQEQLRAQLFDKVQEWLPKLRTYPPPERLGSFDYFLIDFDDAPALIQRQWPDGVPQIICHDVSNLVKTAVSKDGSMLACMDVVSLSGDEGSVSEGTAIDILLGNKQPEQNTATPEELAQKIGLGALLRVLDLKTGRQVATVEEVQNLQWAAGSEHVLYTQADYMGRTHKVYVCAAADTAATRRLVLEEPDASRFVDATLTKDSQWLLLHSHSKISSEVHILDALNPLTAEPRCVAPRREGLEYFVEHWRGFLLLLTNYNSPSGNLNIMCCSVDSCDNGAASAAAAEQLPMQLPWSLVLCGDSEGVVLEDVDVMADRLVVYGRALEDTRPCIGVMELDSAALQAGRQASVQWYRLPEWVTQLTSTGNHEPSAPFLTLALSSPVHPVAYWDFWFKGCPAHAHDAAMGEPPALGSPGWAVAPLQGGLRPAQPELLPYPLEPPTFDGQSYRLQRAVALSQDGTTVPVTIVSPATASTQAPCPYSPGRQPTCLHVYGAYGECMDLSPRALPMLLLSSGWAVAWAHVRGGGERGRQWHAAGRAGNRVKGLQDLDAAVDLLISSGLHVNGQVALVATSAGGVLAGAYYLRHGAKLMCFVGEAPFLALHSVMTRPELLLTVHEYPEWGNPSLPEEEKQVLDVCPLTGLQRILDASQDDAMDATHIDATDASELGTVEVSLDGTVDAALEQPSQHALLSENGCSSEHKPVLAPVLILTSIDDKRVPFWAPVQWFYTLQELRHQRQDTDSDDVHETQQGGEDGQRQLHMPSLLSCQAGGGHHVHVEDNGQYAVLEAIYLKTAAQVALENSSHLCPNDSLSDACAD